MKKIITISVGLVLACLLDVIGYSWVNYVPDQTVNELSKRWAQWPSQFVNVAGMSVHFRDEGPKDDPEPIILIHGTGASLHTWDAWSAALVDERRVIRFDLPAFGLTGPEPNELHPKSWTLNPTFGVQFTAGFFIFNEWDLNQLETHFISQVVIERAHSSKWHAEHAATRKRILW